MSDYFDSKLLDEYDHIVFGPFWGDVYWEYAKWQSFIRWYTNLNPDKTYEIWTRKSRESLYLNIHARILRFDYCSGVDGYEQEGYKLKGYPQDMREEVEQGIERLYTDKVLIFKPPYIDRDDFFNPKQMDLDLFVKYKSCIYVDRLIHTFGDKKPIVLCPPKEGVDDLMWKRIYKGLSNSDKYLVFVVGGGEGLQKMSNKYGNFNYVGTYEDYFGMNLGAMTLFKNVYGDESNPYFKIAEELKFIKTYSMSNKSSLDIGKILKCNV